MTLARRASFVPPLFLRILLEINRLMFSGRAHALGELISITNVCTIATARRRACLRPTTDDASNFNATSLPVVSAKAGGGQRKWADFIRNLKDTRSRESPHHSWHLSEVNCATCDSATVLLRRRPPVHELAIVTGSSITLLEETAIRQMPLGVCRALGT